jgi:predicted enzyme related to lactoylglutathione lyase
VKKWYNDVLKLEIDNWNGTVIKPQSGNETIFSFFAEDDSYFPAEQQVMLNFQVHDLNETLKHLEQMAVPLAKEQESSEYGKFVWIKDPDGRLIELWEK